LFGRMRAPLERREETADVGGPADLSLSARSSILATSAGMSIMAGCAIREGREPVNAVVFEEGGDGRDLGRSATGEVASFG